MAAIHASFVGTGEPKLTEHGRGHAESHANQLQPAVGGDVAVVGVVL
jgi:hypothetical protein